MVMKTSFPSSSSHKSRSFMSGSHSGVNPYKRVGQKKKRKQRIEAVNKTGSRLKELWCKIRFNMTSGFVVSWKCLRIRLRKTQREEKNQQVHRTV